MDTLINDLQVILGISTTNNLIALSAVIVAFVSLIFLFKKLL